MSDGSDMPVRKLFDQLDAVTKNMSPELRAEVFRLTVRNLLKGLYPDAPYQTIKVCCTGRGQHRTESFGKGKVYPNGQVDFTIEDRYWNRGTVSVGGDPTDETNVHLILRCPHCPRRPELSPATLNAEVAAAAAAGQDRLDISLLGF